MTAGHAIAAHAFLNAVERPDLVLRTRILDAMRANAIPSDNCGLWSVKKASLAQPFEIDDHKKRKVMLPPGHYTNLWRHVLKPEEMELVMTDFPHELNTHLDFAMKAHGQVLITGLGLGCVARGCLANPRVSNVTVVERDGDVLQLVQRHMAPSRRLSIIHCDALDFAKHCKTKYDCAWHDLWSDPDINERHLQVNHSKLFVDLFPKVRSFQGAWAMARYQRRLFRRVCDGKIL